MVKGTNKPKGKAMQLLVAEQARLHKAIEDHNQEERRLQERARNERETVSVLYGELHEVERDIGAIERLARTEGE